MHSQQRASPDVLLLNHGQMFDLQFCGLHQLAATITKQTVNIIYLYYKNRSVAVGRWLVSFQKASRSVPIRGSISSGGSSCIAAVVIMGCSLSEGCLVSSYLCVYFLTDTGILTLQTIIAIFVLFLQ